MAAVGSILRRTALCIRFSGVTRSHQVLSFVEMALPDSREPSTDAHPEAKVSLLPAR